METLPQTDENTATIAQSDLTAGPETNPVARDPAPPEVDPTDKALLARVASEIHALYDDDLDYLVETVRRLAKVKKALPKDQWRFWLQLQYGWSEDQAQKLMDVYNASVDLHRR